MLFPNHSHACPTNHSLDLTYSQHIAFLIASVPSWYHEHTHNAKPAEHIGLKVNRTFFSGEVSAQRSPHARELMKEAMRSLRTGVIKKPQTGLSQKSLERTADR